MAHLWVGLERASNGLGGSGRWSGRRRASTANPRNFGKPSHLRQKLRPGAQRAKKGILGRHCCCRQKKRENQTCVDRMWLSASMSVVLSLLVSSVAGKRLLAIPDIHGDYDIMREALGIVTPLEAGDKLVLFLCDSD